MKEEEIKQLKQLIKSHERGHLNEGILAEAIANRSDQAALNALGVVGEWLLIIGVFVFFFLPKSPNNEPSQSVPSESLPSSVKPREKFIKPTVEAPITSPMGMRFHPVHHFARLHAGIDIGVPIGTQIVAPASGTVILSQYLGECGYALRIKHAGDWESRYCHNSKLLVPVGAKVNQGEAIALSGNTGGFSTGPHLHFEIRNPQGEPVDPLKYVKYGKNN